MSYVLTGDEMALDYFEIGQQSGEIRLSQSLVDSDIERFSVSTFSLCYAPKSTCVGDQQY